MAFAGLFLDGEGVAFGEGVERRGRAAERGTSLWSGSVA